MADYQPSKEAVEAAGKCLGSEKHEPILDAVREALTAAVPIELERERERWREMMLSNPAIRKAAAESLRGRGESDPLSADINYEVGILFSAIEVLLDAACKEGEE